MTVCLLLAAGNSSRMGEPKMLLPFNGKSLLQHTIDEIQKLPGSKLLVVTGCYHSLLKEILQPQGIAFIENDHWQQGMGSSIQKGIKHILEFNPGTKDIIILVCDQPYISSALLNEMAQTKQQTGKGIIACTYDNSMGTPVLFDKKYFELLAGIEGQYGAKKIVQQFKEDTATVDFPPGIIDIDTPADYSALINKNS